MQSPELGNGLVVRRQPSQQPHQLDIAPTLRLQPSRGTDLLEITVQIELQQITRIVARPPGVGCLGAFKSQIRHVQPIHKRIDHPAHMIVRNQFFQTYGKQRALLPSLSLYISHKKDALAFARASSHFSFTIQSSFVTDCKSPTSTNTCEWRA